ncbi:Tetratricopeptide TPR_2 repeat protein [Methylobacterium sp. 4-46]|uniref:tetratricopeptide repeat protein n=1 Tax=unclassified Methylobacterium TaxID=2615210 RepID=UPI000152DBA0|nr:MULTISPECIES: tetratricopeptide repeat protein [Methylobacterium]ACA19534.1 Tetratricopeptide TPR_2 repeat protein [Methylobacterium sp. 4-46]WFT78729.1 tetratricopeptide repeat protein [Methylobacterium nodulans]
MQRPVLATCLSAFLLCGLAPAGAVAAAPPEPGAPAKEAPRPPATLDDLFARLKAAKDDAEARGVAQLIERRLDRSGSDTVDLLASRAGQALKDKDAALAVELLDRVVTLEPGWAEGWSRRATAFYLLDDQASALADLHRALQLEPRHFEAWSALAHLYMASDDKERALAAFRRAEAIYPRMGKLREAIEHLAPAIDGRDL